MQLSYRGKELLKEFEGFRNESYLDTGLVWTIGYGTIRINGKPVQPGMVITEQQAEMYLEQDTAWAQTCINKVVKTAITQNMFDALVSFVYNVGEMAFMKSTMLKLINAGLYQAAAEQFMRWVYDNGKKIKGLENRRIKEMALFKGQA